MLTNTETLTRPASKPRATLAALYIAIAAFTISTTILLPSVPVVAAQYDVDQPLAAWVITGYMVVAAIANPLFGRLGDIYGARRIIIVVLSIFAAAAAVGAFAPTIEVLIAARAMQGVSAATIPLAISVIRHRVPDARRALAVALVGAMSAAGAALGMPLGGLLAGNGSVQPAFFVGGGMSIVALVMTVAFVRPSARTHGGRLDYIGAILLAVTVVMPLTGFSIGASSGWRSWASWALLGLAPMAATVFWIRSSRVEHPFLNTRLLRSRGVATTNAMTASLALALFSGFALVPLIAQAPSTNGGLGLSPVTAGLLLLPTSAATFLASVIAGLWLRRGSPKLPLLVGSGVGFGGFLMLGFIPPSVAVLGVAAAAMGVGFGCLSSCTPNLIVAFVPLEHTAAQTGVASMVQNLGQSVGAQVAALTFAAGAITIGGLPQAAFAAFIGAVTVLVAAVLTISLPRLNPGGELTSRSRVRTDADLRCGAPSEL
ncbi:MFS transporter [Microbacterium sp. AGC85]